MFGACSKCFDLVPFAVSCAASSGDRDRLSSVGRVLPGRRGSGTGTGLAQSAGCSLVGEGVGQGPA